MPESFGAVGVRKVKFARKALRKTSKKSKRAVRKPSKFGKNKVVAKSAKPKAK